MMRKLDFTIGILLELFKALQDEAYQTMAFCDFLQQEPGDRKICIIRHDVDRDPKSALNLAALEKRSGIRASYYFRYKQTFDKGLIQEIASLGHEIGYHYETLSGSKGDYAAAFTLFKQELEEFRKIVPVVTICAHGSVLSGWDNRRLWEKYDFKSLGILGEAYLSLDFNKVLYLTDTGRSWQSEKSNIWDRVETNFNYTFGDTFEIIAKLKNQELPHTIMFSIHPNRWSDNLFKWATELVMQNTKNIAKRLLRRPA